MGIVEIAILLVVLIAICGIVYWFLQASGISIPQPIRIALLAIVAIIAILFVASLAGVGPRIL